MEDDRCTLKQIRGGWGMRKLLVAAAATLVLAGCSTGSGQVDVNNGGEFRFVAGTPFGEVIPEGDRASAP